MKLYTMPDGTQITAGDQFQIGDQRYPAGWLSTAPDGDIAAAGITVQIVDDPAPSPTLVVSSLAFRQLFTAAEREAITAAGMQNTQIRLFIDDAGAAGALTLSMDKVTSGIAALVTAGLLTQDRANMVLAGTPPAV